MKEIFREVHGVKISTNEGKTWRTVAVCNPCLQTLPPTTLTKECGEAGVRSCDWCGCINGLQYHNKEYARIQMLISKDAIDNGSLGDLLAKANLQRGETNSDFEENLPTDSVMLDIAFSPVIPLPFGALEDAVEVEEISENSYRYSFRGEVHTVNAEQLKEMRARFIVANNARQAEHLVAHRSSGVWATVGKRGV